MLAKKRFAALAAVGGLLCASGAQAYQLNDDVQLGLKIYTDLLFHSGDTPDIEKNDGVRFRRAYLTVAGRLSDKAKVKLTLDQRSLTHEETRSITDSAGDTATVEVPGQDKVFVKYLYLDYKVAHDHQVRFGLGTTPFVAFDEKRLWGYRWIAKSFTDQWKMQSSADLGLSLIGKAGGLRYQVSALNGEGYQNTPDGRGFALAGRADLSPAEGWLVGAWFHNESQRAGKSGYDPSRAGLFVSYRNDRFRALAQYVTADDGSYSGAKFKDGKGYNLQGGVRVGQGELFLRWDAVDAKDSGQEDTLLVGGYAFKLTQGVDLAVVLRQDTDKEKGKPDVTDSSYGFITQIKL